MDNSDLFEVLTKVKRYQNRRLRNTYEDLIEDERFSSGAQFFLEHLYGDSDLSNRDAQAARVLPKAEKLLPSAGVQVLSDVLEMDCLAEMMDQKLSISIINLSGTNQVKLDDELYLRAFREAGQQDVRLRQVHLVQLAGTKLAKLMRLPLLATILKMSHGAAQKAGLEEFHQFLTQGVVSFKAVKSPSDFFGIIQKRESALLERIFIDRITSFENSSTRG